MKNFIIAGLLLVGCDALAQVRIEVTVTGSATGVITPVGTLSNQVNATLMDAGGNVLQTNSYSESSSFVSTTLITYTTNSGNTFSGKISGIGKYNSNCKNPDDDTLIPGCKTSGLSSISDYVINYSIATGRCYGVSINSTTANYNYTINVTFYGPMSKPTVSPADCSGSVSLTVNDTAPSFDWQVSENGNNWFTFRTSAPSSIDATINELFFGSFSSNYSNRRVRAIGTDCLNMRVSGPSDIFHIPALPPVYSISSTSPSCHNGQDGTITVNITGQGNAYNGYFLDFTNPIGVAFQGSLNGTSRTFSNADFPIISGNWTVVVRNYYPSDVNVGNCAGPLMNVTLSNPPELLISPFASTNVSCNINDIGTKNDGTITLNLQNGTAPYSYEFSSDNGSNFLDIPPNDATTLTPSFAGLASGDYVFKAKYNLGAAVCTSSQSSVIHVGQPSTSISVLKSQVNPPVNVLCKGKNTGAIQMDVSGGNGDYTYSWTATGAYAPYAISAAEDISSLYAGLYKVSVTDSKGCQPGALPLEVPIIEPTGSFTITPIKNSAGGGFDMTCAQNDGEISLSLANQAMPLQSVSWKKDGVPFSPVDPLDAKNLSAATYSITIIDNKGCDASASKSLIQHPPIIVTTEVTSHFNGYNTTCPTSPDGEGRVLSVANGFGSYSYVWSNATTNQTITDLVSGNYSVTVTDDNGCSDSESLLITSPPSIQPHLQVTSNYNGAQISCPAGNDGRIEAFPVNGFGPASGGNYYYSWSHDPLLTTKFSKDLAKGLYKVMVSDGYGCSVEESVSINDPVAMNLTLSKKNYYGADVSCHNSSDGEIQLAVTNGATPYSYSWSDGKSTKNNIGITPGNYTVTVTDANSCQQSKSITLLNPDVLTINIQHVNDFNGYDISCYNKKDGATLAVASGGTGTYNYEWTNGINTADNAGLAAGNYSITVSDVNHCFVSASIDLIEPTELKLSAALDNPVSCFGLSDGQVSLTAAGGVSQYEYSLDPFNPSGWRTQPVFSLLPFGSMDFYLKDGNGCSIAAQKDIPQPEALDLTFKNIVDAACNDPVGSASAIVKGGNSGFVYKWFDDATNQPLNSGAVLQNAIAGIYRVEIKDSKNCSITDQVAISSIGGATFAVDNITGVSCFGFKDGTSSVSVNSGIAPYTYFWSDGQSSPSASALAAGKYFITVIDGLGCKTIQQVDIPTPQPLTSQYVKTMPLCTADSNGHIEVIAAGGTIPYQYNWTTLNKSSSLVSNISAGTYDLKLSDAHGCLLNDKVELKDPDPVKISAVVNKPICLGRCDGSIVLTGGGGTGVYSCSWEGGATTSSIASLCPGDYKVQMKDSNGCLISDQYTVLNARPLPLDLGTKATLCVGQTKVLDPGPQWVTSNWTSNNGFAKNTSAISIKDPGIYYYKGIDTQGCIAMDTFKLDTSFDLLKAEFLMPAEIVVGDTLVAIDISWPLPERVEWNYPSSFKILPSAASDISFVQPLEPGIFSITMKSFLAECRDLREKTLTVLSTVKSSVGGRLGYEELINEFSVYPNPNDGVFSVFVSLAEERQIRLKLIQFPIGIVITDYFSRSSYDHKVDFELPNIPAGLYVLLLDVEGAQRIIRFLKK